MASSELVSLWYDNNHNDQNPYKSRMTQKPPLLILVS